MLPIRRSAAEEADAEARKERAGEQHRLRRHSWERAWGERIVQIDKDKDEERRIWETGEMDAEDREAMLIERGCDAVMYLMMPDADTHTQAWYPDYDNDELGLTKEQTMAAEMEAMRSERARKNEHIKQNGEWETREHRSSRKGREAKVKSVMMQSWSEALRAANAMVDRKVDGDIQTEAFVVYEVGVGPEVRRAMPRSRNDQPAKYHRTSGG
jgi:hypothetical protein